MAETIQVHFFRTDGFSYKEFVGMFRLLETISGTLDFHTVGKKEKDSVWDFVEPMRKDEIGKDLLDPGFFDNPISELIDTFPTDEKRNELKIEPDSFIVILTNSILDDNCFCKYDLTRDIIVRTTGWEKYTDVNPYLPTALLIYEAIIRILLGVDWVPADFSYDLLNRLDKDRFRHSFITTKENEAAPKYLIHCLYGKDAESSLFNLETTGLSDSQMWSIIETMFKARNKKLLKEITISSEAKIVIDSFIDVAVKLFDKEVASKNITSSSVVKSTNTTPIRLSKEEMMQQKLIDIWCGTKSKYYQPIMDRLLELEINDMVCVKIDRNEFYWEKHLGKGTKTYVVAFFMECQRAKMLNGEKYYGNQEIIKAILSKTFNIPIVGNDPFKLLKDSVHKDGYLRPFRDLISKVIKE